MIKISGTACLCPYPPKKPGMKIVRKSTRLQIKIEYNGLILLEYLLCPNSDPGWSYFVQFVAMNFTV